MGAADKGIPAVISKANKTGTVGFKPTIAELVQSLNKKKPAQPAQPQREQPQDLY